MNECLKLLGQAETRASRSEYQVDLGVLAFLLSFCYVVPLRIDVSYESAILLMCMNLNNLHPDMFLRPPFESCPFCGHDRFGVWEVEGRTCDRYCPRCQYREGRTLPQITKRLIYLDQFVITSIVHAYRPETRRSRERKIDAFWREFAERIFRLGAWQVLACPHTLIHLEESIVDDRLFGYLQRVYNYLDFGVSVHFPARVHALQIGKGFRNFLLGDPRPIETPAEDIAWGLHDWQKSWLVLPHIPDNSADASIFREGRSSVARDINDIFDMWRKEQSVTFDERCEKEAAAPGEIIEQWIDRFLSAYPSAESYISVTGNIPPGIPPTALHFSARAMLNALLNGARDAGFLPTDALRRRAEFLRSNLCRNLPANRLSGLLYARLAHEAKNNRKKPLSRGMSNDVFAISTYLPYMDAMFIDNECRWLLNDKLVASRLSFSTKLYSSSNRAGILKYLDEFEASPNSIEHLRAAQETYGDHYIKPDSLLSSESRILGLPTGTIRQQDE